MNVLVFVIAIVLAIIIGTKLKTNIGVISFAMALLVGGAFYGLKPDDVLGCFPSRIFFYMLFGTFFYGFGMHNGTFQNIAQKILWKTGRFSRFMPLIMYFTMAVVMALGAGSNAGPAFLSPIFFGIVIEMGMHPLVAALGCFSAATAFNLLPWTSDFAQKTAINIDTFGTEVAQQISMATFLYDVVFLLLMYVILCFITGGFKKTDAATFQKPDPMNREQKYTLIIIAALAVILVVPMILQLLAPNPVTKWMSTYLDFRVLAAIGIVFCHVLKIGDINEVIKKSIPWAPIMTICGTGTLVGLAAKIGVADTIGAWLGSSVPAPLVAPAFMLVCGALSLVVSGAVVQPLMVALIPGLAMSTGCNPCVLAMCMMVGLQYAGFSPFSAGGTMATLGCTDEKMRQSLVAPMVICAIAFVVITALFAWIGVLDLFVAGISFSF